MERRAKINKNFARPKCLNKILVHFSRERILKLLPLFDLHDVDDGGDGDDGGGGGGRAPAPATVATRNGNFVNN